MTNRRIRLLNSEMAVLVALVLSSSSIQAQQPIGNKIEPNSLRTSAVLLDNGNRQSSSQDSVTSNRWVDAIRLASLPTHREPPVVTAISVSPVGDLIAAAGDDHAIRIVNLSTGKTIATLLGHLDWVQSVEFSPDGSELASCGNDGTLRIWSLGAAPKLIALRTASHALMTLVYVNDKCIYTAGFSNRIYRYDEAQRELAVVHTCDCRDIRSIVASPDRTRIAFGGRDGVLRVRDVARDGDSDPNEHEHNTHPGGEKELVVLLHSDRIRTLQFSDNGNQITSVGEDRRIVHYDLVNRTILGKTEIGGGKLLGLCQLEPHLFAVASSDNTIRIFRDSDQSVQARLVGHDGSVSILKRTKSHLISGSFDTTIRIWDIDRAISSIDQKGRYTHPVAAQFEDSGAGADVK